MNIELPNPDSFCFATKSGNYAVWHTPQQKAIVSAQGKNSCSILSMCHINKHRTMEFILKKGMKQEVCRKNAADKIRRCPCLTLRNRFFHGAFEKISSFLLASLEC